MENLGIKFPKKKKLVLEETFFFKTETETTSETDYVAHVIEEVVNLARQLDLEVSGDDINI